MLYLETTPDTFAPWAGEINEVCYPLAIGTLWSAEELAAIGLSTRRPRCARWQDCNGLHRPASMAW